MRTDRTWPLPTVPWVMRMRWEDLLFAHWSVCADVLRRHLPASLELDTFQGQAYVGVVPFRMSDVAPRGMPAMGGLSRFPELNVRTYVIAEGKPGVFFFSLDAASRLAVRLARQFFFLPYMDADMSLGWHESGCVYRCRRTHRAVPTAEFRARYAPQGPPFQAEPGTLEHWLTARYCLYVVNRRGKLFRGEIDHVPWPLQQATAVIETNTCGEWLGMDFSSEPHLLFAKSVDVRAWLLQRVAGD